MPKPCKPCSPQDICNPKSGRCVKRSGKIGKALLTSPKRRASKSLRRRSSKSLRRRSSKSLRPRQSKTQSKSMPILPVEIMEMIVKHAENFTDLFALYNTNKELKVIAGKEIEKRKNKLILSSKFKTLIGTAPKNGKFKFGDHVRVISGRADNPATPNDRFIMYNSKKRVEYIGKRGTIMGYEYKPGGTAKYIIEFTNGKTDIFHSHFIEKV